MAKTRRRGPKIVELRKFHREQQRIYNSLSGRDILRCGRRFGKTTLAEDAGCNWAMQGMKVGWFSPSYKLLIPSYKRILKTLQPVVLHANRMDGIIELEKNNKNGLYGEVEFWTLNDEDAGRSRSYDYVIIDEASLVLKGLKEIWDKSIAPTLVDRGGKALMAGTPKGIDPENFFYTACTDKKLGWKEFHAPTHLNPTLQKESVDKLEEEYPPLVYLQEFKAEFVDWGGAAFFARDSLLVDGTSGSRIPVAPFRHCASVFAVVDTAMKDGKEHDGTAVTYFAYDPFRADYKLIILDWDIIQIEGSLLNIWIPNIFANLEQYAKQVGARLGSMGVFVEDKASGIVLNQQARRNSWPVHPIDSKFTSIGKEGRALSVSKYVHQNLVKITEAAFNKSTNYKGIEKNHFLGQVHGFRPGLKDGEDDLLDTFCYGVANTLGNSELW